MPQGKHAAAPFPIQIIERRIYLIRHEKVILDSDLAELYGVQTKVLNQAVMRNRKRFPVDFMFQLGKTEALALRSQFVTSKARKRGGRQYLPYAFTEQGVAMLSSVLKSDRAIQVNIAIMRAFVKIRGMLATNRDLATKFEAMEAKYNRKFAIVFEILQRLAAPEVPSKGTMGFDISKQR